MGYWDFGRVFTNYDALLIGLWGTLRLAAASLVLSLALGLIFGAARYSRRAIFYWPATVYVEVFRNTPVLVQIMWFYFAFPTLAPFEVNAFTAALLALSLNSGAFTAEIFRGGIQSIAPGQWEAGRALGMTYGQQMRRIILPQAVRRMLPAFANRGIELFKLTSLAATISFQELLYSGKAIAAAYYSAIESFTAVAFIYVLFIYPMTQALYILERRWRHAS